MRDALRWTDNKLNYLLYEGNALGYTHLGQKFSTRDQPASISRSCAVDGRASWWVKNCPTSNLNGRYYQRGEHRDGVVWWYWKGGTYSLRSTEMKIRPV